MPDFEQIMAKARRKNRRMDAIEHRNGFATPAECGPRDLLKTAESAIEAGIRTDDWDCVAEGLVMLSQGIGMVTLLEQMAASAYRRM